MQIDLRCVPKPRMVSSDKWKIPKGVASNSVYAYILFGDQLRIACRGFKLSNSYSVIFYFAMPSRWSKTKKEAMRGKPMQDKPDLDNCLKSIQDILRPGDDQAIFSIQAMKIWADGDSITLENRIGE